MTPLSIPIAHFVPVFELVLGRFTEVTASGTIRFPEGRLVDQEGKPTGEVVRSTVHDQVAVSGIIQRGSDGVFVNIHGRVGMSCVGEAGRGRRLLQWIIDGEEGSIEVTNREDGGIYSGPMIAGSEKDVFLNGEKVELEVTEEDQLDNTGKAWLEFAKGKDGKYTTLDDAVRIHRVVDAALTSIKEGKKVIL